MKKNVKIIIAVVLVILVVVICCFVFKKDKTENNVNENITTSDENAENSTTENEGETNAVANETVEDSESIVENVTEVKPQGTVYESDSNAGTTDKKQEAINLVKQVWGEDDTVTFRCDSVGENGEYIIAVVSKQSASVKNYFKVNLNSKSVDIDY